MKKGLHCLTALILSASLQAQERLPDLSGKYSYAIVDTPYGDYFGVITLRKKDNSYQGEIVNEEGVKYSLKVVRTEGSRIVFKSNLEESKSLFMCEIKGDSIAGNIKVTGDDFNYVLKGKRSDE